MAKDDDLRIEIWKQVVGVQKHFNEIEMKIRSIAVTILGALLGAAGYAQASEITFKIFDKEIYLSLGLILSGFFIWFAFYFMDRHWYHRLLMGSVNQGIKIEDGLEGRFPEITLTKAIGKESPFLVFGKYPVHSNGKYRIFYWTVGAALLLVVYALFNTPLPRDKESILSEETIPLASDEIFGGQSDELVTTSDEKASTENGKKTK